MDESSVHHEAASPGLANLEREVAVVAVEEAVALVEAAQLSEKRAPQEETDPIHHRDLRDRRSKGRPVIERVNDRASDIAAVAANALDAVKADEAGGLDCVGAYGWGGFWYTIFFVDPAKDLIGICMAQIHPYGEATLNKKFKTLVYEALVE